MIKWYDFESYDCKAYCSLSQYLGPYQTVSTVGERVENGASSWTFSAAHSEKNQKYTSVLK